MLSRDEKSWLRTIWKPVRHSRKWMIYVRSFNEWNNENFFSEIKAVWDLTGE